MRHLALLLLAPLCLAAPTLAQRSLADLQKRFVADRDALIAEKGGRVSFEDIRKLATRHAEQLQEFVSGEARGTDAVNGRLMLTNIWLDVGDEAKARTALLAIDTAQAPPMELLTAAEMAQVLGMQEQRRAWIALALDKDAPFDERMALGMFLMTRLVEVAAGEKVFADAARAAKDDEERAKIGWYRAAATREREDVEEDAWEKALRDLAAAYPDTYFGGVARDRLKALELELGSDAIPTAGKTLDGREVSLADFAGKVVLLDFWSPTSREAPAVAARVATLAEKNRERGFEVLGVAVASDRAAVDEAVAAGKMTWPILFDGRGFLTDAVLRWGIGQVPDHVLIGRDGKVRATRIYLLDDEGMADLQVRIDQALGDR